MIDRELKRVIGQMAYGVSVVAAAVDDEVRAYTSTWVCQLAFSEPVLGVSISPKHDTWPLIEASGRMTISLLAGDQIEEAQYFSYPGRRFKRFADYFVPDTAKVANAIGWMDCGVIGAPIPIEDHLLVLARVDAVEEGRLDQPPLVYSSRQGWRIADTPARAPGESVRDELLRRLDEWESG